MNPTGEAQPQPVATNMPKLPAASRNPKSVRYSINLSIVLDAIIVTSLIALFVQGFFYTGPDSGFATILGFMYVVIAIIPAADGYILYRSSRQAIRSHLCSYWAISRSLALLVAVYYFYDYAVYGSTLEMGSSLRYTAIIIAAAVLFGGIGIIFYRPAKGKWQLALLMGVVGVSLLTAGYINVAITRSNRMGANGGLAGARRDNQTARDFQLLSQEVEGYALNQGTFPTNLQQAANGSKDSGSDNGMAGRLRRYAYKYDDSTGVFDLCATFSTDTTKSEADRTGVTKAYKHAKGYQCFSFQVTGWTSDREITAPPAPSSQNQQTPDHGVQIYNVKP